MKIFINSRFLTQPITGVQRFAIEISKQLKILYGDRIEFISPYNVMHHRLAKEFNVKTIGILTNHLWEQIDLPRYLKKQGSPILLNLANTAPFTYKNKLTAIHDIAFKIYPQTYTKSFLSYYNLLFSKILETSEHIITVSHFSKEEIMRFYNIRKDKISVVYNAVNANFKQIHNDDLQKRNYFLIVSSLNYRKNLIRILEAFENISAKDKKLKLYLIGDLNIKSFKKIDISKYIYNKKIEILGRVNDAELVEYYSNARGFIYPSLYEGFGIPPLEAQACNCPVLLSNGCCFPEVFGDSALYCDPFSINSIQIGMQQLLDKEIRDILIKKGDVNTKRFSWEISAKKISEILEKYM
ncbi:MAG: glycosyltransferase family 4 protein [Tannerellaceae bacterium]|jgi:glycosyltransferase involved in cell wall biosynthesis|nr:glycosyltransferase family 4 protein [Tannerellaceae bacterium]